MTINSSKFWDKIAHKYSERPIADPENYERKLAETQALMRPEMKVLEFGCGTGSTALLHAPNVGHIEATDVSAEMISIARAKAVRAGIDNVTFKKSSVDEFKGSNGSYDMILALNLLHLLPNRAATLSKIYRLLKPGGLLISSTVCLADRMWFLRPVIPVMQWLGSAPYVDFIKAEEIRYEARSRGFEELDCWTHGRANTLFLISAKPHNT